MINKLLTVIFTTAIIHCIAYAAEMSPADIVNQHLTALETGDMDAVMSDYADDAVILQSAKAISGKDAIRAFFESFLANSEGSPVPSDMKVREEGDIGFVEWKLKDMQGTDVFLIREGKIEVQAIFINLPPQPVAK